MFGRPIDPFQHLMNMRCAHEAAHNRFRTQMSSSDPEVRQTGLSNHHLYLKQLLDEQAGYETDLFKCLKHIDRAVAQWTSCTAWASARKLSGSATRLPSSSETLV